MDKLLARKGIQFVSYADEEDATFSYAFTPEMLKEGIIVLLTEYTTDLGLDTEEEVEEEDEWEEDEAASEEDESEEDDLELDFGSESLEQGPDATEVSETALSVLFIRDEVAYECSIALDDRPVVPPLYIYRLIVDLIEIISGSSADDLFEDLEPVSIGLSSSDDFADNPDVQRSMLDLTAEHIGMAIRLAQANGSI